MRNIPPWEQVKDIEISNMLNLCKVFSHLLVCRNTFQLMYKHIKLFDSKFYLIERFIHINIEHV